jgi:hypothetical protein
LGETEVGGTVAVNAINVIASYKHHGMWVFDEPRVGLVQEPFVAGADTMIDWVVADLLDADRGFTLIFSDGPFPGFQHPRLAARSSPSHGQGYCNMDSLRCDTLAVLAVLAVRAVRASLNPRIGHMLDTYRGENIID